MVLWPLDYSLCSSFKPRQQQRVIVCAWRKRQLGVKPLHQNLGMSPRGPMDPHQASGWHYHDPNQDPLGQCFHTLSHYRPTPVLLQASLHCTATTHTTGKEGTTHLATTDAINYSGRYREDSITASNKAQSQFSLPNSHLKTSRKRLLS